jgi:hypothetical protein
MFSWDKRLLVKNRTEILIDSDNPRLQAQYETHEEMPKTS